MGYSIAFLGDLSFPQARGASWLAATIDPAAFTDWPDDWQPSSDDPLTVGELLDEVDGDFVSLERTGDTIRLRLLTSKDDAFYLGRRNEALCAFRQAAAHGGNGSLVIVGWIDAPSFGVRVTVRADGTSACVDLARREIEEAEKSAPYTELQAIVEGELDKLPKVDLGAQLAAAAQQKSETAAAIFDAPTIDAALAILRRELPDSASFREQVSIPRSPLVDALVGHPDPGATDSMRKELRRVLGGPLAGEKTWRGNENGYLSTNDRVVAFALLSVLQRRGGADDEVATVWIEHPDFFLRNHEGARALGRPELDVQLASLLGVKRSDTDNQRWVVEALMASDPEGAPARATELLAGDPRKSPGALEALRWIASYFFERPEARSPAWEEWLRQVALVPWTTQPYDFFDQIRKNALGVMALWKMPEALAEITAHLDSIDVARACDLLESLGDPGAVPALENLLAKTRRKDDKSRIERAIAKLSGAPPAAPETTAPKSHAIEVSPSGRAGCRGCKEKIAKGELRFGEAVKNVFQDSGELTMRWFHLRCAAEKKPLLLLPVLDAYAGDVTDRDALNALAAAAVAKKKPRKKT